MTYAILCSGIPVFAPNPVLDSENYIGNPSAALYLTLGYKPVLYCPQPEPQGDGYYSELWTENDEAIVQTWEWVSNSEISDEEALRILIGGDEIDP